MAVTRLASQCPAVQMSTSFLKIADALASASGISPSARGLGTGDMAQTLPKWNQNALQIDLAYRYGGGSIRAVAQGLTFTATGGILTVQPGHAIIEGLVEIATAQTGIAVNTGWNYIWVKQTSGSTGSIQVVTGSTLAPTTNSCFIGAINIAGGAGTADTSGVVYSRDGLRVRYTADANAPSDSPPATVSLYTKTTGGLYLWDGAAWQSAGSVGAAYYLSTIPYSNSDPTTHDNYKPAAGVHWTDADRTLLADANKRAATTNLTANTYSTLKAMTDALWSEIDKLEFVRTADPTGVNNGWVLTAQNGKAVYAAPSGFAGTLPIAQGGTGATDATAARSNLGIGTAGTKNVPSAGDAASTEVVLGSDSRFSLMTGATANANGTAGRVPAPPSGNFDKFLRNDGTWAVPAGGSGGNGTVTSVGLSIATPVFTVTQNTVTDSGTLTFDFAVTGANTVLAGPASGTPDKPTMRALVAADLPSHQHSAADLNTGTLDPQRLPTTTATPGSYTNANVTVDATGRITSVSNGVAGGAAAKKRWVCPLLSGFTPSDIGIDLDGMQFAPYGVGNVSVLWVPRVLTFYRRSPVAGSDIFQIRYSTAGNAAFGAGTTILAASASLSGTTNYRLQLSTAGDFVSGLTVPSGAYVGLDVMQIATGSGHWSVVIEFEEQ